MKTTVLYTLKTILLFTFIFFIACDSTTESKNSAPVISAIVVNPSSVAANGITTVTVTATDADDDPLTYAYDPNGNVGQALDNSGSLYAHYEYDPYGNVVKSLGSFAAINPYRFSTKYFDSESGLYYYGYRYYLIGSGRWLNRDPIGERGGLNLYLYIGNSSINSFDPVGQWWPSVEQLEEGLLYGESPEETEVERGSYYVSPELIKSFLKENAVSASIDIPLKKILVFPIVPFGSVELKIGFSGKCTTCCKGSKMGLMAEGEFIVSLSGGVGTIIGGQGNTKFGKNPSNQTIHSASGNQKGKFTKNPFLNKNLKPAGKMGVTSNLPQCKTGLSLDLQLNGNLISAAGIVTAQASLKIGSCQIPGTCHWDFDPTFDAQFKKGSLGIRAELEGKSSAIGSYHFYTYDR